MEIFIKCPNFTITSKMRAKSFALTLSSIFALVFVLAFAGAVQFVDSATGLTTITTLSYGSVNQGASSSASFKIKDDIAGNDLANLVFTPMPVVFTSGSNTFNSYTFVSGAVLTLADGTTSNSMSLTISVPSTQKKGTYTGTLILDGEEPAGTGFPINPSLVLSVIVVDITDPVITLTADSTFGTGIVYVPLGATYTDAGATALDETDGSVSVTSTSTVNTLAEGTYAVTYTAVDSSLNSATAARTVIVYNTFCTAGSSSTNLNLNVDIANKGNGEDNEWQPLDTIEIEVEFDNSRSSSNGAYDLNDVIFEIGIFDSAGKDVAGDMIWISEDAEKFEFGDVDEGDDAKHVFEFRVNPAEFSADGNYKVKIKAYPAGKEAADCIDYSTDLTSFGTSKYSADISVNLPGDDEAVVVDEKTLPAPASAQCEQAVAFSADIWNIGNKDFEDKIMIALFNSELGVSENKTLTGDLDQGENTQVTFTFDVPAGVAEKIYNLDMKLYYDWDADNSEYDEVSKETFNFPLTVSSNCVPPELTISASLESGGKAGESLVVKSTITNTGDEETTYTFALSGYSDWASNAKINNTLTLAAGQSGAVTVSFDVDKKADGDKTFNIEAYSSDSELLKTQPVQVGIEGKQGFNFSDSDSLVPILIALISAIVIAIIIVLLVKASKK